MSTFTFSPPGMVDVTWSLLAPRSRCCKLDTTQVIYHSLFLGQDVQEYPSDGPDAALAAMIALYEATDPADLGDPDANWTGYVVWNSETEEAEIVTTGGSTFNASTYMLIETPHDPGDPFNYRLARSKQAVRVGWVSAGTDWRSIDGGTAKCEYQIAQREVDYYAAETGGITIISSGNVTLTMAPGDSSKWSDWIPIGEPGSPNIQYIIPGDAYADRDCVGD
mgnify:CR=1 FL=1